MPSEPPATVTHLDRVVQIVGRGPDDRPFFVASGLLLVGDLAITAAHVVRDATTRYELRPVRPGHHGPGATALTVRRVVPYAGRDLALLVLDAERGALPPLRFAELPYEMGQIAVHAVGFPRFAVEDSRPRSHQIDATVQLGSDRTEHQLQLSVQSSDPPAGAPGTSPWAGFSGAGILTKHEGLLAGIAASHRPAVGQRTTTGTDLSGLTDPEFLELLTEHGVEPAPVPVRPATVRAAGPAHWLPDDVWAVLSRQHKAADELPHRFRQDRRPRRLTAVYVRQLLIRQETEEERGAHGVGGPADGPEADAHRFLGHAPAHGPEGAPRPPSALGPGPAKHSTTVGPPRRLESVLAHDESGPGHVLVEAGPGAGKSTLLHSCALDFGGAALAAATGHGRLVPLWVTAARLTDPGHSLESAVAAATGLDTGDGTLPRLPHGARWLVLVDALDEVHHDRRGRLIHRLADQAEGDRPGGLRMLVTTRPDPEGTAELSRAGFRRYALDPFDRRRLEEFAHTWFRDARRGAGAGSGLDTGMGTGSEEPDLAGEFLRQIDDTGLSDLLRNPLLATVTAVVFENAAGRPLPDNRWALYEEYRAHLRATKREQVRELWRDLDERASGTRHGQQAVAQLRERTDELLRQLAYTQITDGARDLPRLARLWWEETATDADGRHFGAVPPVDGWADAITEALLGTGMFVRRGRDLEFLHTTFTEHLAAEQLADRLPDTFDPASRQWRTAIVAASGRGTHPLSELHRTALVHYGHRHRTGGQALLDWLQQGPFDDQLLAGELLAARCPAQDVHHQRFLTAMKVPRGPELEGPAWELLSRMRNPQVTAFLHDSTHGTGLRQGLAATALMYHDAESAARALLRLATDPETNPELLHDAATELAETHPAHTADAAAVLQAVLSHPQSGNRERSAVAASLAALGDEYVASAAEALMALIDDAGPEKTGVEEAIQQLRDLGGEYEHEAALRMVRLAEAPALPRFQQLIWLEKLCALGEPHAPAPADALRTIIDHASDHRWGFRDALSRLARLGGPYLDHAAVLLLTYVGTPDVEWHEGVSCAAMLAGFGEEYTDRAAWAWHRLIDVSESRPVQRLEAAKGLRRLGEPYDWEALLRVPELSSAPSAEPESVSSARSTAPRGTVGILGLPAVPRLVAAKEWAAQGESFVPEAVRAVDSVLAESFDRAEQEDAAALLHEWGEPYLSDVERSLRERVAGADGPWWERYAVACGLLALGRLRPPTDTALLLFLINRPSPDPHFRERAAEVLRTADEGHLDQIAHEAGRALADPGADASARRTAANTLTFLGSAAAAKAASALHADVTRQDAGPRTRIAAARGLLLLGGPHVPVDTDILRAVVADGETTTDEQLRAVEILLSLDRRYTDEAARLLYATVTGREVEDDDFFRAVGLLLGLGERHQPRAVRALRTAIHRWHRGSGDLAAWAVSYLGEPYTYMAAKAIRGAARRPWASADDREDMATALVELGHQYKPDAARILSGIIRLPWAGYLDRTHAAEELAELGEPYAGMAAKSLVRAPLGLMDRTEKRQDLAEFLISLGEDHWPRAARLLLRVVNGRMSDTSDLERAVNTLSRLGEEFRAPTLSALRKAARGRRLRSPFAYGRADAARALAALESRAPRPAPAPEAARADVTAPPTDPLPPAAP